MTVDVFDAAPCALGEGPLWHPEREALFWFDILRFQLHSKGARWSFGEHVSAAGWVDRNRLLIASETQLLLFDLEAGSGEQVLPLEHDIPTTRSNDGRADPWGGFWIGTMGKAAEPGAGAIYRYYRGDVRCLFPGITIPNSIAFEHDRSYAYFSDTRVQTVWRQRLSDRDGWPVGEPEVFLDLSRENLNPDGAVVDAEGWLWIAIWGLGRVVAYDREGRAVACIEFPALNTSCPAFGGRSLDTLYCTSARQGLSADELTTNPNHGRTFSAEAIGPGLPEYQVLL
ncbi:MAG: SMP-30/gluconolactonase/LRE family protein [Pseudomonadota bacterium]